MTQIEAPSPDELNLDPAEQFGEGVAGDVRDPWPFMAEQRENTPVSKMNVGKEMGQKIDDNAPKLPPVFSVFSHALVHQVLSDDETYSSANYSLVMGPVMGHTILEMDKPEHPRHRALVARAFRQKMLERWNDTLIRKTVHELLDKIVPLGRADLVRSLTFPFPVQVIARILGLPDHDWPKFQRWSIDLISVFSNWERGMAASQSLCEYFERVVEDRRVNPQDDLITQLVEAEIDGQKLSNEEIFSFLRLLLPAGAETTYRSSGNLLYALLTHPDQLEALRKDRLLIPQAIEEGLRWEPPILFIQRMANKDVTLGGVDIPAGALIAVGLGAANRDPAATPDPDRFDIHRDARQHITFGTGPHMCLGMHLARLETRMLLDAVLDRLPNLRLDPDTTEDPHIHGLSFRSPTSLPVLFDPS